MERERLVSKSEFSVKKALGKVVLSSVVAISASHSFAPRENQQSDIPQVRTYETSLFMPFKLDESEEVASVPVLSEKQIEELETKKNLENIVLAMKESEIFPKKYIEDVKMYYPIYEAVAKKHNIDWYLLFIVHEKETGASAGSRGFASDSYYVGAMQRDPNIWTEEYVDSAFEGLEYLSELPQRREEDARDIAGAAKMLSDNYHKYRENGHNKIEAVKKALLRYSAKGPALKRFEMYKDYKRVFSEVSEFEYTDSPRPNTKR